MSKPQTFEEWWAKQPHWMTHNPEDRTRLKIAFDEAFAAGVESQQGRLLLSPLLEVVEAARRLDAMHGKFECPADLRQLRAALAALD